MRLGDPEAAAVVERHGDRLGHVRFAGEEASMEAVRQRHLGGGLVGRRRGVGVGHQEEQGEREGVHGGGSVGRAGEWNCSGDGGGRQGVLSEPEG